MNIWVLTLTAGLATVAGENLPQPTPALTTEQAARLYRIEVYQQFRTNRAEYDRRIAQGEQVWNDFQAAGQPREHRDAVVQWFVAAREATATKQTIALPLLPTLPASEVAAPEVAAPTKEQFVTSGREEHPLVDRVPTDVATDLEIQLPPNAVQTEPIRDFGSVVKQSFAAFRAILPEAEGTTEPLVIELPKDSRVVDTTQPEMSDETKPVETPKAESEAKPTSSSAAETPAAETEDPFAVKALFDPAPTTPTPATEADPFAP